MAFRNQNVTPALLIYPAKGVSAVGSAITSGVKSASTVSNEAQYPCIPTERCLSAIIRFFADTANATYNFRIWGRHSIGTGGAQLGPTPGALIQSIGAGTFSISSGATAISGTTSPEWNSLDGKYVADSITYAASDTATTPSGPVVGRATALGETPFAVYSPGSNTAPAELTLGSIGRYASIIIEFTDQAGKTKFAGVTRHFA